MSHTAEHRARPGSDPTAEGWHLQGLGESEGRLSHSLSPRSPQLCLLLGLLSALFMSRSLKKGDEESYLHSNITFKSYKLLTTINNLPADGTARKNLGLRMHSPVCAHIQPHGIFLLVMTVVLILLVSECNAWCNEKFFMLFFWFHPSPTEK